LIAPVLEIGLNIEKQQKKRKKERERENKKPANGNDFFFQAIMSQKMELEKKRREIEGTGKMTHSEG